MSIAKDTYEALDYAMVMIYGEDQDGMEVALVDAVAGIAELIRATRDVEAARLLERWVREQKAGVREPEPVE